MLKAILVIVDGMADRPIQQLNWKTPIEASHKPTLDRLAKNGICGIIDPISPGKPPGSDTATLALLGYEAVKVYSGRGALEALGSGITVPKNEVAFRCNFATVNKDLVVVDRRAGRIATEEATKLAESLQKVELKKPDRPDFLFKNTIQHRAVLVLRGSGWSTAVSDSDPGEAGQKVLDILPLDKSREAALTAEVANRLLSGFRTVLEKHPVNKKRIERGEPPANMILCRGVGTVPQIEPLPKIYPIKAACVGATALVKGVCKAAGMELIHVPGATGTFQTDYLAKATMTVKALEQNDFVLLHVKAADAASHDRNVKQKIEVIERVDNMLNHLLKSIDMDSVCLAVTADHTTSVFTGRHEGDPVPIVIAGSTVRRDDVTEYGERSCAKGGLNRIRGLDLMPTLMDLIGKTGIFGA